MILSRVFPRYHIVYYCRSRPNHLYLKLMTLATCWTSRLQSWPTPSSSFARDWDGLLRSTCRVLTDAAQLEARYYFQNTCQTKTSLEFWAENIAPKSIHLLSFSLQSPFHLVSRIFYCAQRVPSTGDRKFLSKCGGLDWHSNGAIFWSSL